MIRKKTKDYRRKTNTINYKQQNFMQELIDKLKDNAGITDEQAKKVLETIKEYVTEKFPMLGGAVDNLLGGTKAD
jgi:nitrogen regulatory protein PII